MHGNGSYSFGGMHFFGWFLIILCLGVIVAWMLQYSKRRN